MAEIFQKIQNRSARVAVVGLGAVGLPLCAEIIQAGFSVLGIDRSAEKIENLKRGWKICQGLPKDDFPAWIKTGRLRLQEGFLDLESCDVICLAVPTPLTPNQEPDLGCLMEALGSIRDHLRKGQALWIESTLYPGATEEVVAPFLEALGLRAGQDFYLAVSPERLDPGNDRFSLPEIPKLVGGINSVSTEAALSFYGSFLRKVVPLTSTRAAEAAKCFENTFRFVNIALVNELVLASSSLKIDPWEVLEAAATKPFGFMPFSPGPGVGGTSLPAASHFLRWKMEKAGQEPPWVSRLIPAAEAIHAAMTRRVVEKIREGLKKVGKGLSGSRVLIMGVTYKENVADLRHSPAQRVMEILDQEEVLLAYFDPFIPSFSLGEKNFRSLPHPVFTEFDAVVLMTAHEGFDLSRMVRESKFIVDPKNAARAFHEYREKIYR